MRIPPQYKADGIWLSKWLNEQRQIYIGNREGKRLTEDQIRRLESIGMTWKNRLHTAMEEAWQEQYAEAKQYFENHGNLCIPRDHRTAKGKNLCIWVARQRALRKEEKLSAEQVRLLTDIGMEWESVDPWEVGFTHAEQYFKKNGNLNAEHGYVCEDGYRLGNWLTNQRANHNNPKQYHSLHGRARREDSQLSEESSQRRKGTNSRRGLQAGHR